ncbi:uncharacterized protein ACA1_016020 [Acanthamoeba castellanii str. Neff]|uniref:Uncharacterized protein n=1 Tax=Acanthamoeba castellanii (strain ATCC 30010 / Neff) TaxID=1257118 RepID=L8GSG6_ACACF|nr:uncharacterized protein ACA1_016020 [Acanthamoeba castellanii str. Neff]ELR15945.1 hypothetical protein ACA1_016020 [Acanthamoeba castellanii str. Neff]
MTRGFMLTFYLAWLVVVLGCFSGVARAQLAGVEITFTNQTFSQNGTNLVAQFGFTQDYASEAVNCTFTFPGALTFQSINQYYTLRGSNLAGLSFPSDINAQPLSSGKLHVRNEGAVSTGTELTYYVWLHEQGKDLGQAFSFGLACAADGQSASFSLDNLVIVDNTRPAESASPSPNSSPQPGSSKSPSPSPSGGHDDVSSGARLAPLAALVLAA